MKFIGDVHGKMVQTIPYADHICIGDYGIGFVKPLTDMKYIRGNHDNPALCRADENYLGDWGTYQDWFFVSGAHSIDRAARTEGVDWWCDEELSYADFTMVLDEYEQARPQKVFTHDCPRPIGRILVNDDLQSSITSVALERMLELHAPKVWVFGHHHKSYDCVIGGTRFICLKELETKEID